MKKDSILVSVIIPAYNCERWITRTLNSVVRQSYKNIEIIIVNDGSTDKTGEILRGYTKYSNIFIYNIDNIGPAEARNYGVAKSNGDLIAFMDADDMWETTKVEVQVSYLEKHNCSLVITNAKIIDENDNVIGEKRKSVPMRKEKQVISLFQGKVTMNTPTIMVRKSVFNEIGGFEPLLRHREDHFFLMRVAEKYGIELIEEPLVFRRIWEGSISNDFLKVDSSAAEVVNHFKDLKYFLYLSKKNFPFVKPYYNREMSRYYNTVAMRLFRLNYIQTAREELLMALKAYFFPEYLLKLILFYSPPKIRRKAISTIDYFKNYLWD